MRLWMQCMCKLRKGYAKCSMHQKRDSGTDLTTYGPELDPDHIGLGLGCLGFRGVDTREAP